MNKKKIQIVLFAAVMLLTIMAVFRNQDISNICNAIRHMSVGSLILTIILSLFFVSAEGVMIWYLLSAMGGRSGILSCIRYSFVGFFYSGITPSATGGQPMQLYYMKKDGNKVSDSSVILMTVALLYKLVLVMIGVAIFFFWYEPLKQYMKHYIFLFFLGIVLNTVVVLVILGAMAFPNILIKIANAFIKMMVRRHIWKPNCSREETVKCFVENYSRAVKFMAKNKFKLVVVTLITLLQRCSVFWLTYIVYRGFHLTGESVVSIMILQAAVYIAVDMLPVPGAQGITEMVYQTVFWGIFTENYLVPSMLVSRGINFYLLLIICGLVAGWAALKGRTGDM